MIKNDKKNRMNGRKMTIHPVFHSLNLSCSIKECKTLADHNDLEASRYPEPF